METAHCQGCNVCVAFCPEKAIDFPDRLCGTWYESDTRFGPSRLIENFRGFLHDDGIAVREFGQHDPLKFCCPDDAPPAIR